MKKGKCKKYIIRYISVLSCALCIFVLPLSIFAAPSDDWSITYIDTSKISGMIASTSGFRTDYYATSVLKSLGTTANGSKYLNCSGTFLNVDMMFNDILCGLNYGSNHLYMYDSYHYTVSLAVRTKVSNSSTSEVVTFGQNYKFVLLSALQNGDGVGNFYVSNKISASSSYVNGDYTYYVFDFDLSLSDDWPSAVVEDNKALFNGFGVVNTGGSLLGKYDFNIAFQSVEIKAYSPDEWQAYVTQKGFDNIHSQVIQGLQEYDATLPDHDFSAGQNALDDYSSANDDVEGMIDMDSVTGSLADGTDVIGGWLDGIQCAGHFLNTMYNEIVTYYGVIPIAVMFSAVALLLGLVKNR